MKKIFVLIIVGVIIYSCGNNKADEPIVEIDSASLNQQLSHWEAELNDTSGLLEVKKVATAGPDTLTPAAVLDFINQDDSSIHIELIKISHDTIYLKIPDAAHLTQQMGSTGPTIYLAGVVYNLTEVPGIHEVSFDFEEGDHASPGVFNRNSFKDK